MQWIDSCWSQFCYESDNIFSLLLQTLFLTEGFSHTLKYKFVLFSVGCVDIIWKKNYSVSLLETGCFYQLTLKRSLQRPLNTLAHVHIRIHACTNCTTKKAHIHSYLKAVAIERRTLANQREKGNRTGSVVTLYVFIISADRNSSQRVNNASHS